MSGGEMVNCVATWGQRLVTGTDAGHLEVRDRDTGQVEASLEGHDRGCGISGLAVGHLGPLAHEFSLYIPLVMWLIWWSHGPV